MNLLTLRTRAAPTRAVPTRAGPTRAGLGSALALLLATAPSLARAQDQGPESRPAETTRTGKLIDVRGDPSEPTIVLDLGERAGLASGQTVEVRREKKTIGYGAVQSVFSDVATAKITLVVPGAGPLKKGDAVVILGAGIRGQPPQPEPSPAPTARDQDEGPPGSIRRVAPRPAGSVLDVRGRVVMLDLEASLSLAAGDLISLQRESQERGQLSLELVDKGVAVGRLVKGAAMRGDRAVLIGRRREPELDFAALSFLGVIADLEHGMTPHRAPCHVGVPVRRVLDSSPAKKGGITPGDRIVAIDSVVVRTIVDVRQRVEARAKPTVRVTLIRGNTLLTLPVVFK